MAAKAHKRAEFLALNAFGEIPVLDDDGQIIADSLAILVYIARKIGPSHWLPSDPYQEAQVQRWLSVAAGEAMVAGDVVNTAARLQTATSSRRPVLLRVDFDSGELGFGPRFATAAANRDTYKTPKNLKSGTYTYFCRVHPFMRGSFRVKRAS